MRILNSQFMILMLGLLYGTFCCSQLDEQPSVSLNSNKSTTMCISKLDSKLPLVIRVLPYSNTNQKKHSHNEIDEDITTVGQSNIIVDGASHSCKIEQVYSTCYYDSMESKSLTIECKQGPCKYNLEFIQQEPTHISDDDNIKFKLSDNQLVVYQITTSNNIDRIVLTLKSENVILTNYNLHANVFNANVLTHQSDSRIIVTITKVCNDCTIPIVIHGFSIDKTLRISLTSQPYQQITKYSQSQTFQVDTLSASIPNVYEYQLDKFYFEELQFAVQSFTGTSKRIRVFENVYNATNKPKLDSLFEPYQYQTQELVIDSIITKLIFIEVSSELGGSYGFKLIVPEGDFLMLEVGQIEIAHLFKFTQQHYMLKVEQSKDTIININLNELKGSVNMAYKECSSKDCKQIKNIEHESSYLAFNPNCMTVDDDGYCYYTIAIVSESLDATYTLGVQHKQETIILRPNIPYRAEINEEEKHYYTFYIEDVDIIKSVLFRVSSPNVEFLVSRKCQVVDWNCKQYSGTNDMPVEIRSNLKEGAYYISVEGIEMTQYSITAEVTTGDKDPLILLQNGQVYQSSVSTTSLRQCFQYTQSDKEVLTVSVHGPNHKLQVFVNDDTDLPTSIDYEEMSLGEPIKILSSQVTACVEPLRLAFAPNPHMANTTYNESQTWMDESLYKDLGFSIVIYNEKSIINLDYNQPQYQSIGNGENNKFSFLVKVDEEQVYLTKHILTSSKITDDIKIYIGNEPYNDKSKYEYSFTNHDSSTYVLDTQKLRQLCKDDSNDEQNSGWICEIFIFVQTTSLVSLRYTLTIHKRDIAIQLIDGQQNTFNLEHILDPNGMQEGKGYMHFYYRPSNKVQDINLFAFSLFGRLRMHINVWKIDGTYHKSDWPFSNDEDDVELSESSDYVSGRQNQIHRSLQTSALDICWPDCLILISLNHLDDTGLQEYANFMNQNTEYRYDDTFSIMATQVFQEIVEGQKMEFTLLNNQYKYFTFRNLMRFRDDSILAFSLMSFVGSGYFSMTVNGNENMTVPHILGQYDFHSDGSYFQITKQQLTQTLRNKGITLDEAYLIIEVGGFVSYFNEEQSKKASKLEFSIHYLNEDVMSVQHSIPHQFLVKPNHPVVVQYYQYYYQDLKIRIQRMTGYGQVKVWVCKPPNQISECIEDAQSDKFIPLRTFEAVGTSNSQIVIKTTDEGYCAFCSYLIEITPFESELNGQITIILEDDYVKLLSGQLFDDSIDKQNDARYALSFIGNEEVDIMIRIHHGNPSVYLSYTENEFNKDKPYTMHDNSNYIHVTLPPRSIIIEDANYNNITLPTWFRDRYTKDDDDVSMILPIHFIHDEIYLLIESKDTDCNYSIQYHSGDISGSLQDGRIHTIALSKAQPTATLIFENYENDVMPFLELAPFNGSKLTDVAISANYLKKYSRDDYQMDEMKQNISITLKQDHPLSRTYKLPNMMGLFEITLTNTAVNSTKPIYNPNNQYEGQLMLEVSVSSRDIRILPYQRYSNGFVTPGQVTYFETLAPTDGTIVLEINSCQSDINLGYAWDMNAFLKENYTKSTNISESTYHMELVDAIQGTLWIAIHDFTRQDAYFSITNHFYHSRNQIPFGKLIPGNQGMIQWKLKPQTVDELILTFNHIECPSCKSIEGIQADYHIFIAQDRMKLNMMGYCGNTHINGINSTSDVLLRYPVQSFRINENDTTLEYELKFPDLVTYENVVVGILVTVNNFMNQTTQMKVFYPAIEIPVPNYLAKILHRNRAFFSILVSGMIVLIILLTLWLCYYMRRLRLMRMRMATLNDVRNVVGLSKLPQNDDAALNNVVKMKYESLEEDV